MTRAISSMRRIRIVRCQYYLPYVGRYFLFASQVDSVSTFTERGVYGAGQTYDKFVILRNHAGDYAGRIFRAHADLPGDPGVYDVAETFQSGHPAA